MNLWVINDPFLTIDCYPDLMPHSLMNIKYFISAICLLLSLITDVVFWQQKKFNSKPMSQKFLPQ